MMQLHPSKPPQTFPSLVDTFGRAITYLRISVTDRCNLRCVYCMPPEGVAWQPHQGILTFEEIVRVVRAAAQRGVRHIRLTGGEPLVRRDLPELVRQLRGIHGIEELSLTTNGILLERLAQPLAEAGLTRVNISLDTLDAEKFRRITRGGEMARLWRGVEAAMQAGLTPIKFNCVVVRGLNDDELFRMANLTIEHPWHMRFIELMPVGNLQDWGPGFPTAEQRYLSVQHIKQRLAALNLQPDQAPAGNGPSRTYRIPGAMGTVGFISPLGEHFCQQCNRLRLTADGRLRPCLLLDTEIALRDGLRQGESPDAYLQRAVVLKPEGHQLDDWVLPKLRRMAQIGG